MRFVFGLLALLLTVAADTGAFIDNKPLPMGCNRFQRNTKVRVKTENSQSSFFYAVHTLILDETTANLAKDIGFNTIVQVFPWRDFNPKPDHFTWFSGDAMVQTAKENRLNLVIRLDMPPEWARQGDDKNDLPFDLEAYSDFVTKVANRYRGQILGYIIWNEPNLAAEWSRSGGDLMDHWSSYSGWVAEPADYVGLLGIAYDRIKSADPGALVITAGLAPTNENSPRAMDDRTFLKQMMDSGAVECFDVLGVHTYGFGIAPDVSREVQDELNLNRILSLREIIMSYEVDRPIWITELGYTIGAGQHPQVTEDQQAEYLVASIRRTRREWPWVKMLTVWNLIYGRDDVDEMSGYSLVNPDLSPRLAYTELQNLLREKKE